MFENKLYGEGGLKPTAAYMFDMRDFDSFQTDVWLARTPELLCLGIIHAKGQFVIAGLSSIYDEKKSLIDPKITVSPFLDVKDSIAYTKQYIRSWSETDSGLVIPDQKQLKSQPNEGVIPIKVKGTIDRYAPEDDVLPAKTLDWNHARNTSLAMYVGIKWPIMDIILRIDEKEKFYKKGKK